LSELTDLLIYQRLLHRGWITAAATSSIAAAPIDSIIFLGLAGFPVLSRLWADLRPTRHGLGSEIMTGCRLWDGPQPAGPDYPHDANRRWFST
jgi:hypothetical protein